MAQAIVRIISVLTGWILDRIFGDPQWLPHPIVGFGKAVSYLEHRLNNGENRRLKGIFTATFLILSTYVAAWLLIKLTSGWAWLEVIVSSVMVFYCLAGKTLENEVTAVFKACRESLAKGRVQVARIVGRDTATLTDQEVKAAALETLSENLSDGVIAPLFWFAILGVPGMLTYKMINTLDSMIGYRNERYIRFGTAAARIDDAANYIPARLTATLMLISSGKLKLWPFVKKYGRAHLSPNSGYPEAALAAILECRFGGPHEYFGETVFKPFIGNNPRKITDVDVEKAIVINRRSEIIMLVLTVLTIFALELLF